MFKIHLYNKNKYNSAEDPHFHTKGPSDFSFRDFSLIFSFKYFFPHLPDILSKTLRFVHVGWGVVSHQLLIQTKIENKGFKI